MRAALVTEYRKIVTTRMWWVLLAAMGAYMLFVAAIMAWTFSQGGDVGTGADFAGDGPGTAPLPGDLVAKSVYTIGTALGYVFPVIVGAIAVTGEVRHQTITPTLLAEPRRTLVLVAKLLATFAVGLLFGVVGTLSAVIGGAGTFAVLGEDLYLTDGGVLRAIVLSMLTLALWAVIGVGFGALLPNQIAAVVVVLAFTQFVEPLLRILLTQFEPVAGIAAYLPGAAGEAVVGASLYSATGLSQLLPVWGGLLVLIAYGVVFATLGRLTTLRRDIT